MFFIEDREALTDDNASLFNSSDSGSGFPEKKKTRKRLYGYLKWEKEASRIDRQASLGEALRKLFDRFGYTDRIREQQAVIIWKDTVGKEIAAATEAVGIKRGVLRVKVQDPVWRNELTYLREEIRSKLNRAIGYTVVSDIKFS